MLAEWGKDSASLRSLKGTSNPRLLFLAVALLAAEWTLRRRGGHA